MDQLTKNIKLAEAKRAQLFSQIQSIYNLIPKIKEEDKSRQAFIVHGRHVDMIREEYKKVVDDVNSYNLEQDEDYVINYQSLTAFDELYFYIKAYLNKLEPPSSAAIPAASSACDYDKRKDSIKVPRIELPTFDGEIQSFPYFYETFKRIIHDNISLTDTERVHYLMSHLTGRARDICAGLVPAAENYEIIWQALITKYKDTRALGTSYLNQLFSLKPAGPSPMQLDKLIDKYAALIAALKQLKIPDLSEFIFVYMGLKLLDVETAKAYEMSIRGTSSMPGYDNFVSFIREQVKILYRTSQRSGTIPSAAIVVDKSGGQVINSGSVMKTRGLSTRTHQSYVSAQPATPTCSSCVLCRDNSHKHLYVCKQFLSLNPHDRFKCIKEIHACTNCLSTQHTSQNCNSRSACHKCNGKHHTLLHFGNNNNTSAVPQSITTAVAVESDCKTGSIVDEIVPGSDPDPEVSLCSLSSTKCIPRNRTTEVLATAKVIATARDGRDVPIRCLLDPGSQKHYMTTKCCIKLGLKVNREATLTVKGIGGSSQAVKGSVDVSFRSRFNVGSTYNITAMVLNQITGVLPTCQIDVELFDNLKNIPLGDESWGTPGEIDLLIGVNLFAEILLGGKIINSSGAPNALETVLGYVVLGEAPTLSLPSTTHALCAFTSGEVENLVRKFWEIENVDSLPIVSADDKYCEDFYAATTTRKPTGEYEVALPFKMEPESLGDSYGTAKRRFAYLERRFSSQPMLKVLYDDIIREYIDKSYLSEVKSVDFNNRNYFIPHHAVIRQDKMTTKVRPVLDASAKSDNGLSLNDLLHAGPNLQRDLFTILLNLRLFVVAISADVRQMYLRIGVRPRDRCFQRILYRFNPSETRTAPDIQRLYEDGQIHIFEFCRVAFGLKCSPFLALRTVSQLSSDEGLNFPTAKEIVDRDLYMDDVASSIINPDIAVKAAKELIEMFMAGGFELVKWSSNCKDVLEQIPESNRLSQSIEFDKDDTLKILGLVWYPSDDVFAFKVTPENRPCTKRNILSTVARLFDVLGLVAPIILYAKLLIKELWNMKVGWDDLPPHKIIQLWSQFQTELPLIATMKFPRHVGVIEQCTITILGFADASERAYGGVIYLYVSTDHSNKIELVCAKSKVAPLKVISLARLELCAALLLSKLIKRVFDTYSKRYPIESILAFSDSTVALNWIHSSPHRWQTFVANRVAKLHEYVSSEHFYHVKGSENPSDCLSRGLTPAQLINHPMWLRGPPWASLPKSDWPVQPFISKANISDLPEVKTTTLVSTKVVEPFLYTLAQRYSSWDKLIKTICYVFKFARILNRGPITFFDRDFAEREIIRSVQQFHFCFDIENIQNNKKCSQSLIKLRPFLENGLLRVGGRLINSEESFEYKHPLLLPKKGHIVELIIKYYHEKYLHTGPELLMSILRSKFWILSARRIIRFLVSKCNVCFRNKPRATFPIMGDLPEPRVREVSKAFLFTGCDYLGPFFVTPRRGRGIKSHKAWICIFSCLTTRALHIELVSELSTACFLAALKRFLSRRGPIKCLYTDNGTNFIGARTYLRELYSFLARQCHNVWEKELSEHRVSIKTIPPSSPHWGGSWESTVKCVKTHLYKVIGTQVLTFEELLTVLTQIECLLNSRPLTIQSSDPAEPEALTPAHFLHTAPLRFMPAHEIEESAPSHLIQRFNLLDQLVQSFWKRWRREYLHTLQVRQKWNTPSLPIKEGMIVVVMQDNTMPLQWPLGVIESVMAGKDGNVRVAQVRTKFGSYLRPVVKLCPLPTQ